MEKVLGKIDFAEFGKVKDYPFLIGLQIGFKLADCGGIMCGGKYTVNINKAYRGEESERRQAITVNIENVYKILNDAKVSYVSELLNKPVEVTIDKNTFQDFRILTEVL